MLSRVEVEDFRISPEGTCLEILSPSEIRALFTESQEEIQPLLERCVLAVMNSGTESDDVREILEENRNFALEVLRSPAGIEIELKNAPESAFVSYESLEDGRVVEKRKIIEGIRQHIFAVLRDLVFIKSEIERTQKFDLKTSKGITDSVFLILRNAGIFEKTGHHKIVVCWGGHALSKEEYEYTVEVGNECGLRLMDIISGCGPGAMKGVMEGATIAHAKQRIKNGRYIGISEPGIIASEPPNPIVDPLVIMPDIEKRLEAFVRLAHGVVVFPGGAGTAEEMIYILGVLSHESNRDIPFPVILTAPESSEGYIEQLDSFLVNTLGTEVRELYRVLTGDSVKVAQQLNKGLLEVKRYREESSDSYYFNRGLHIPYDFKKTIGPDHEAIEGLELRRGKDICTSAATLRQVFSAVVSGNVKPEGIKAVEDRGPFRIHGDRNIMDEIDGLLSLFVDQGRMRLKGEYEPCYRLLR